MANYLEEPNECAPALGTVVRTIGGPKYPGRAVSAEQLSTDRSVEVFGLGDAKRREGRRRPAEATLKRKLARSGSAFRLSGNLMAYIAGLSWLPGTAASAALKPAFECVPSQKGLVIEPPQRHSANGRLEIWYCAPFQSTSITSSPSTKYGPFGVP